MRIVDDIDRRVTAADYDSAKTRLKGICTDAAIGLGELGFFGEVRSPGISDLDVLIVADPPKLRAVIAAIDEERKSSPTFRYVLWHPPVYLIEACRDLAPHLHTLQGLRFCNGVGSALGTGEKKHTLLNAIWFTFLTRVVLDLTRKHEPVSLRMLLLIHKNLEHSRQCFGSPAPPTSFDLRQDALSERYPDLTYYADALIAEYQATAAAFDAFLLVNKLGGVVGHGPTKSLIINRAYVISAGQSSSLGRCFGGIGVLNLSAEACALVWALLKDMNGPPVTDYGRSFRAARDVYRNHELSFPFITPFGMASSRGRIASIYWLNRIVAAASSGRLS